jgi:hypothetical protein
MSGGVWMQIGSGLTKIKGNQVWPHSGVVQNNVGCHNSAELTYNIRFNTRRGTAMSRLSL